MEYSRNYLIHYYEIDSKRKLSLSTLIHYLEDLAMLNSTDQGLTLDYYDETHRGWMLFKWDINIYQYPMFNETIKISTHPSAFKNFLANREYSVFNKDGKLLAEAKSVWLFADTKTRRPLRVPEEMYSKFDVGKESEAVFYKLDELSLVSEGSHTLKVTVRHSDTDTNKHVNNVRYIDWAMESLPESFREDHIVKRVQVNYKKELNPGDEAEVVSLIHEDENELYTLHTIYNTGKDICNLKLQWKKNL